MSSRKAVNVCILIACLVTTIVSCRPKRDVILEELRKLELSNYEKRDLDKKTEAELLDGIRFLEDEVDRTVNAGVHLGTYYKMVATKYRLRELYGLAAEYYRKALNVYPTNPIIAFWTGVCVAKTAVSFQTDEERIERLKEAAGYYQFTLDLDPRYTDAMYALSILYVFEFDDPEFAEPLLETMLTIETRNYRAMFLLAQVYVIYGRIDDAVALYDTIADESGLDDYVSRARQSRNTLLGGVNAR